MVRIRPFPADAFCAAMEGWSGARDRPGRRVAGEWNGTSNDVSLYSVRARTRRNAAGATTSAWTAARRWRCPPAAFFGSSRLDRGSARALGDTGCLLRFSGRMGAGLTLPRRGAWAARVEIAGLRYATRYSDTSGAGATHEPPLSFYNGAEDADLHDTVTVWRLHAGTDYALSRNTSLGLKLTLSAAEVVEGEGSYETHPMHGIDPDFSNTNAFEPSSHAVCLRKHTESDQLQSGGKLKRIQDGNARSNRPSMNTKTIGVTASYHNHAYSDALASACAELWNIFWIQTSSRN